MSEPKKENYDHIGVFNDEYRAWHNRREYGDNRICLKCDGTGNQLFFMFQACTDCNGKGIKP